MHAPAIAIGVVLVITWIAIELLGRYLRGEEELASPGPAEPLEPPLWDQTYAARVAANTRIIDPAGDIRAAIAAAKPANIEPIPWERLWAAAGGYNNDEHSRGTPGFNCRERSDRSGEDASPFQENAIRHLEGD